MTFTQRSQALSLTLLLTAMSLAFVPSAQAIIEPVDCIHDIANSSGCAIPTPTPGTPVGGMLHCDYMNGEVGGEVHAGTMSIPLCYSVDPAPVGCGGNPGVSLSENNNDFDQCVDPGACPAPFVGQKTSSSLNEANNYLCVDPNSPNCGTSGVEFYGQIGSATPFAGCIPVPSQCGPTPPAPGWGITIGGPCIFMVWLTQTPCAGFVGTEITIGHPNLGPLVNVCL